jgi:hypothetical protein
MHQTQVKRIHAIQKSLAELQGRVELEVLKLQGGEESTSAFNTQVDLDETLFGLHYTAKSLHRLLDRNNQPSYSPTLDTDGEKKKTKNR